MDLTAPQRFLAEAAPRPGLDDYKHAIKRKPGALELYLEKAKKVGFSNNDLIALLGYALKEKIIDMAEYKFRSGQLGLAKVRKQRVTGKIDPRDTALRQDDDDEMAPICVSCKKQVPTNRRTGTIMGSVQLGGAWVCWRCSDSR